MQGNAYISGTSTSLLCSGQPTLLKPLLADHQNHPTSDNGKILDDILKRVLCCERREMLREKEMTYLVSC